MVDELGAPPSTDRTDPAALHAALGAASDTREAREYLGLQSRLTELQIAALRQSDRFELSHLRLRRFGDYAKAAMETTIALFVLALAIGFGALLWQASNANGLVVAPLRTPPDFAAKGLDGTTLSQRLLDKLNALVAQSSGWDFRAAEDIRGNWGDDSKVEIPNTGVSVSELSRSLRLWLGNETHVGGEIWRADEGLAIAVRAGTHGASVLTGSEKDIDQLLDRAAEQLLKQTQPTYYINLLRTRGDLTAAESAARELAAASGSDDKPWVYLYWAEIQIDEGRNRAAIETLRRGGVNPLMQIATRSGAYYELGALEAQLGDLQTSLGLLKDDRYRREVSPAAWQAFVGAGGSLTAEALGDYAAALQPVIEQRDSGFASLADISDLQLATYVARMHDPSGARRILKARPEWEGIAADSIELKAGIRGGFYPPRFFILMAVDAWEGAFSDLRAVDKAIAGDSRYADIRAAQVQPWLAYAAARSGNVSEALRLAAGCPAASYLCLDMRGRIEAIAGASHAPFWFARAVEAGPSLPFAYADWGEMLMQRGDYDGAIAKFEQSHEKGPRYADPLELWGEALMQENRSDFALAKFEEANKYAPRWGRLHLKWGEALFYVGRRDDAKAQFATASRLDMSADDKAQLARWDRGLHG